MGFAEQIGFPLEPSAEPFQVIFMHCRFHFIHNHRLPRTSVLHRMFGKVVDEAAASTPFLHSPAKRWVELYATLQKKSGDLLLLKTACTNERLRDGGSTGTFPC